MFAGRPKPAISWWKNSELLDDDSEISEADFTVNTLYIPALRRDDLNQNLTCRTRNSNITAELGKSVQLDMICRKNLSLSLFHQN